MKKGIILLEHKVGKKINRGLFIKSPSEKSITIIKQGSSFNLDEFIKASPKIVGFIQEDFFFAGKRPRKTVKGFTKKESFLYGHKNKLRSVKSITLKRHLNIPRVYKESPRDGFIPEKGLDIKTATTIESLSESLRLGQIDEEFKIEDLLNVGTNTLYGVRNIYKKGSLNTREKPKGQRVLPEADYVVKTNLRSDDSLEYTDSTKRHKRTFIKPKMRVVL